MLEAFKLRYTTVPEQMVMDGRFPTVKSPNPENAEALSMGMELADAKQRRPRRRDRPGLRPHGRRRARPGRQARAADRQPDRLAHGVLPAEDALRHGRAQRRATRARAVIIKTFVTTDLQKAIAEHYGVRCIETLTGFKYIGQKLGKYEAALPAAAREHYRQKPESETRALRLAESSFYVFGGEESYGYSGADFVRDKDANGATVMFTEVAAYAKSQGMTLVELLDEVYATFGFYLEKNGNIVLEGADGAAKIQKLLASYDSAPPKEIAARR